MSLSGQINKISGNFSNAIRNAAMKGNMDSNGALQGTQKIEGYVCNIHGFDDEDKELRGTIDVQEYDYNQGEDKIEGAGLHKGVLCSAIQNNECGFYIMPMMYSDVVIVQNPKDFKEYVLMYSHVDVIQLRSHNSVEIRVAETEEFREATSDDDDLPDYNELKETGNTAATLYDKETIMHTVGTKDGNTMVVQTPDEITITTTNTTITIDADGKVTIEAKEVTIAGETSIKTTSPQTTIDGNKVEVTGGTFIRKGTANVDGQGGFCGIPVCPFTGAIHTGSTITGG